MEKKHLFKSHWAIGDKVIIDGDPYITGVVTEVLFDVGGPHYKVCWFFSGDHKQGIFPAFRLDKKPDDDTKGVAFMPSFTVGERIETNENNH